MLIGKDKHATTLELIKVCLNQQPQGGFSYKDLQDRERIDKAIKKEPIKLEDADYKNLQKLVEDMRWTARHEDILDFVNEFVTK